MSPKSSITLNLPRPPSVNRLWKIGRGKMYRSPEYVKWLTEAGWEIAAQKPALPIKSISGHYSLIVRLRLGSRRKGADLDNFSGKALSDLLQKHGITQNDSLCIKFFARWDDNLPVACRVTVRSISSRID